ncbi:hypothetical protein [Methanoculleus chikugoensis]|uniref:hypothetical protein n=1 Tax=Methanoculleus chikugoensis TaxID=118126 RepID=UPI000A71851F|nr:hypothetical protein [Methanoculleus chikugoensis]
MRCREEVNTPPDAPPVSVYEVHLGSWRMQEGRCTNYQKVATELADYLLEAGFTHVEFLPVMEHPLYASWGLPDARLLRPPRAGTAPPRRSSCTSSSTFTCAGSGG